VSHKIVGYFCVLCLLASCGDTSKKVTEPVKEEEKSVAKGIVELPSGLKYEVLKAGTSEETPSRGKKVVVHYAGWFEDTTKPDGKGQKFDSSVDRGQKFAFNIGVGQVIKGWDEGIMGMKVGEKRRLVIPYQLAYGENGFPGAIPPKSTLIFEVELFNIS
jgi:FKBP-type peptidyl-prolyl cis-trans isomerase